MPGQAAKVVLTEKQQAILRAIVDSRIASVRLVQRSQIILLAFEKRLNEEVSQVVGLNCKQVGVWRKRWQEASEELVSVECSEGMGPLAKAIEDLLADAPRSGPHPAAWPNTKNSPEVREAVLTTLHSPPSTHGINRTTWKMDDLHRVLAENGFPMSRQNIRWIIRKGGFRWRKAKKVLTSNDPEYRAKVDRITSILSSIGPKQRFFSIDEFGPFHITMKGGRKLVAPGEEYTVPQWQKSKGCLIVTGAVELCTNQVTHFFSEKKNTDEMIRLLDVLLAEYAGMETLYLSWDAASWHLAKKFEEKVASVNSMSETHAHIPTVELAPLPAGAQFLNVIESVFSGMARAIIQNSDYQSEEEAMHAIDRYFKERNAAFKVNPKRAGKRIWGEERVQPVFSESHNCKDPRYR